MKERGRRTDEILEAVRLLLTEDDVTYEGRYYRFENVTIEPRPPKMPAGLGRGRLARARPGVLRRAGARADRAAPHPARPDGWISRCSGNQEWVKRDWEPDRRRARGRRPARRRDPSAHTNFTYLVETANRDEALAAQRPMFDAVMGTHRTFEHLQESYLLGTIDDIMARLKDLESAGSSTWCSARRATTSGSST